MNNNIIKYRVRSVLENYLEYKARLRNIDNVSVKAQQYRENVSHSRTNGVENYYTNRISTKNRLLIAVREVEASLLVMKQTCSTYELQARILENDCIHGMKNADNCHVLGLSMSKLYKLKKEAYTTFAMIYKQGKLLQTNQNKLQYC